MVVKIPGDLLTEQNQLQKKRQGHEYHLITRKDVAFNVGIRMKLYVYRISARAVHGLPEFNLMPRNQSLHKNKRGFYSREATTLIVNNTNRINYRHCQSREKLLV